MEPSSARSGSLPAGSLLTMLDFLAPVPPGSPPQWVLPEFGPSLFEAIRSHGFRRLALQVPAGLTRNAHEMAAELRERTGAEVVLLTRACFGACDLPSRDEAPRAEAAVVLGHSPIPNVRLVHPTFFVEMRHPGGSPERLAQLLDLSSVPRRLGVVASVQHLDLVEPLRLALEARKFHTEVGSGDHRLAYPVQALGCNYTSAQSVAAQVDAFLFVGTGRFHPIGLALATDRPVYSLDPLQEELTPPLDRNQLVRERLLTVARARDARRWGILVSTFVGQDRSGTARALREHALRRGREAEILVFSRLDPRDLDGRDLDAYVNTACPRIAIDDGPSYARPMLTPPEFLMALGEIPMTPYRFDTYH